MPGTAHEGLRSSDFLLVLSGAGLSAESGVPTFRGAGGLWKRFRAEELATPEAFQRMPEEVWAWYRWRLDALSACRPNAAHHALARWAACADCLILNQNVDGLLEAAFAEVGLDNSAIVNLHGTLRDFKCSACGMTGRMEELPADPLPRCQKCSGLLRPAVVWFGEMLSDRALDALHEGPQLCDTLLSVGTSGQVWPAAGVIHACSQLGKSVIEINPDEGAFAVVGSNKLTGQAAELLPALFDKVLGKAGSYHD
jgi:NAD-dependent deacetylase